MKGCINNKMGRILIDTDVIALYAGTTAVECFGIVGMERRSCEAFKAGKPDPWHQRHSQRQCNQY